MNRVVVIGMGAGTTWREIAIRMLEHRNAVVNMPEWDVYRTLETRFAAPVLDYRPPQEWSRKQLRSLGRMSQFCVQAAGDALTMAGLAADERIKDGRMGVASASSTGATDAVSTISEVIRHYDTSEFNANTYIKMMPHTTAANVAIFYGLTGRVIPTSCACASATQAIGYSFESIRHGMIDMILAGGGEELCPSEACVFDALYATSTRNVQSASNTETL